MHERFDVIGPFHVESSGNLGGTWQIEMADASRERAASLARRASEEDRGERLYRVFDAATEDALQHFRGGAPVFRERGWN